MLATLERIFIVDKAEEIAKMVLQSDAARSYRICLNKMTHNSETQKKIKAFIRIKEQYEEVQRFGKFHPDYKLVMRKIREVKREMDLDVHVAAFRKAENELQTLLDEISVTIAHSVSEQIKVPTGNPFFASSCGSGCGTGGSCSCSA
ncbi:YlbF family regulator [Bacillaceae bacterium Marseille-Q3522]|nr:YlbF family regulator [Bacillaceae bacterium Marseille-Q3522]